MLISNYYHMFLTFKSFENTVFYQTVLSKIKEKCKISIILQEIMDPFLTIWTSDASIFCSLNPQTFSNYWSQVFLKNFFVISFLIECHVVNQNLIDFVDKE